MKKKGMEIDFLGWLILGIIVLVVVILIIMILSSKGMGAIDYIKSIFGW